MEKALSAPAWQLSEVDYRICTVGTEPQKKLPNLQDSANASLMKTQQDDFLYVS